MFYLIRETTPLSTEHQIAQLMERAKGKPLDEKAPAKERVNPATLGYYPVKMEVGGLLNEFRAPTESMSYNQPMIEQIYLNHGFVVFRYASDHSLIESQKIG